MVRLQVRDSGAAGWCGCHATISAGSLTFSLHCQYASTPSPPHARTAITRSPRRHYTPSPSPPRFPHATTPTYHFPTPNTTTKSNILYNTRQIVTTRTHTHSAPNIRLSSLHFHPTHPLPDTAQALHPSRLTKTHTHTHTLSIPPCTLQLSLTPSLMLWAWSGSFCLPMM
ncbi:hypothetical protein E2C01_099938 [Portunus trituberculatus]|uniref:Uncharacterized protein n=1 Tax=Portunus trituberculatus TaxID=210409 RepID=A0A5B7KAS6_PORTR|nr:hypothetical protein [Portunus trituberculatus]